MTRSQMLQELGELIASTGRPHPLRVAIDGVDAAGKTTFAEELGVIINGLGRPPIRASIDGFHRPKVERYRRGADSPEGYYLDSFNYDALVQELLTPLGPGGTRQIRTAIFDFRNDSPVSESPRTVPKDSILLFDGVFLLRPEINVHWDIRIFLEVDFQEILDRVVSRDRNHFGTAQEIRRRYLQRYIPGQQLYLEAVRPQEIADFVLHNDDLTDP